MQIHLCRVNVIAIVLNATFNNISVKYLVVSLFAEETGVPGENNRPVANH